MHSIPTSTIEFGFRKPGAKKSPVIMEGSTLEKLVCTGFVMVMSGLAR